MSGVPWAEIAVEIRQVAVSFILVLLFASNVKAADIEIAGVASAAGVEVGAVGIALPDWSEYFIAVWSLDESTNQVRRNDTSSTCGATCDLSATNVDRDTVEFMQGDASAHLDSTSGDTQTTELYCDADDDDSDSVSNCTPLNVSSGNLSFGAWVNGNRNGTDAILGQTGTFGPTDNYVGILHSYDGSGDNGYGIGSLWYFVTINYCIIDDIITSDNHTVYNVFHHISCTYNNGSDTLNIYRNATAGTPSTSADSLTSSGEDFVIGEEASDKLNVHGIDEAFVAARELTATDVCRICSCGIRGAHCSCSLADATAYLGTGRNSNNCNSCTLPNCNSAIAGS